MVFKEIDHIVVYVVDLLPASGDGCCRFATFDDGTQRVVKSHLVIQIVEAAVVDITTIEGRIVDFGNKDSTRILFLYLRNNPMPEIYWHHEYHITAETIDSLLAPIKQDVQHLVPCIWHRVEMVMTTSTVIHSIVQLHGLIPIVARRRGMETVVASSLCRIFLISVCSFSKV